MAAISDRSHDRPPGREARDPGAPVTGRTLMLFAGMVLTGSLTLGLVTSGIASLVVPSNQIGLRPYLVSSLPAVLMLFIAILPGVWCHWFWRQIFPRVDRPGRRRLSERRRRATAAAAAGAVVPKSGPRPVSTPPDPAVTERAADLLKRREQRRLRAERQRLDERRREEERRRAEHERLLAERRRADERARRAEDARRRAEELRLAEHRRRGEERRKRQAAGAAAADPAAAGRLPVPASPATKATPLTELRLPTRVVSTLARAGIDTIEQLTSRTQVELLEIKGIGARSLEDILAALDGAGRALRYPQRVSRIG